MVLGLMSSNQRKKRELRFDRAQLSNTRIELVKKKTKQNKHHKTYAHTHSHTRAYNKKITLMCHATLKTHK